MDEYCCVLHVLNYTELCAKLIVCGQKLVPKKLATLHDSFRQLFCNILLMGQSMVPQFCIAIVSAHDLQHTHTQFLQQSNPGQH